MFALFLYTCVLNLLYEANTVNYIGLPFLNKLNGFDLQISQAN